jgi:hypothetical protein
MSRSITTATGQFAATNIRVRWAKISANAGRRHGLRVLLHFDRVGYVLVGTTLPTFSMMYFINRKIGDAKPKKEPPRMMIAVEDVS